MAKLQRTTERYAPRPLTVAQLNAIDLLAQGKTDTDTAEALGVHRVTVTRWRLYSPEFQAQLNRRRRELWDGAADKLRALVPRALDRLAEELEYKDSDALKAAVAILKLAGLDKLEAPSGQTNPALVLDDIATEQATTPHERMLLRMDGATDRVRLALAAELDARVNAPIEGEALLLTEGATP